MIGFITESTGTDLHHEFDVMESIDRLPQLQNCLVFALTLT